ncbi:hypothetical protein OIV57_33650, partial [Burkholderia pseudomallei]|uniref:hypothetical protein n=1 Tax=Burkholderia pseudomallei TaxID=28450 RepID=UPI0021F7B19C
GQPAATGYCHRMPSPFVVMSCIRCGPRPVARRDPAVLVSANGLQTLQEIVAAGKRHRIASGGFASWRFG